MAWTIAGSNSSSYCQHLTLIEAVSGIATKALAWPADYGVGQYVGRPLEVLRVRSQFWTSTTATRRAPKLIVRDGFNRSMHSIVGIEVLGGTTNDYRIVEFAGEMVPFGGTAVETSGATLQKIHRIPLARGLLLQPGWSLVVTQDGDNGVNTVNSNALAATGGTFTLTANGQVTTALAFNANAATVQAALEALSNIGVGGVRCEATTGANLGANSAVVTVRWMSFESAAVTLTLQSSLTGGGGAHTVGTTTTGGTGIVAGDTNVAVVTAQVAA